MPNKFLIVCGGSGYGLLGQRRILGVDGELHIDVRKEIKDELAVVDEYSLSLKLDMAPDAGTSIRLLNYMERQALKLPACAFKRHTEYLVKYSTLDVPLEYGLARSPALGGGAIRHNENLVELDSRLNKMIEEWTVGIGADNPLTFWIVSSTAGGTGEGTHRFVGERIVKLLSTKPGLRLTLNFIRIGPDTYRAIDDQRTTLNSFFGIAADAAFKVKIPRDYRNVNVSSNWFYLEVPPVGVGDAAKPIRWRLIEMACKAIMLDELRENINTIVVNDGIGLVRVGYWGRDFSQRAKYAETLRQLIGKLSDLVEPNGYIQYVADKPNPKSQADKTLEKIKKMLNEIPWLVGKMEREGWKFPRVTGTPTEPEEIKLLVPKWKTAIDRLIAPDNVDLLGYDFLIPQQIKKAGTEESETRLTPLQIPQAASIQYSPQWFERIDAAQQVKAWATEILEGPSGGEGLLTKLSNLAQQSSKAQYPSLVEQMQLSPVQRATNLRDPLTEFVDTLVRVARLIELRDGARDFLDSALIDSKNVLEYSKAQFDMVKREIIGEEAPVIAADLGDPLDQLTKETWLKMLDTAVKRSDEKLFEREVLKGATGLTQAGLLSVLELPLTADADMIRGRLRAEVGRMYDKDGKPYQAQWWSATKPADVKHEFKYRIMPHLEPRVRYEIGTDDREIKYLYTKLSVIGMNVLAFEIVSITARNDTVTTPAYLLSGLSRLAKEYLTDEQWIDTPIGTPSAKFALVSAGVGGEPLYKPALQQVGLSMVELDRLAEFYELYDPHELSSESMATRLKDQQAILPERNVPMIPDKSLKRKLPASRPKPEAIPKAGLGVFIVHGHDEAAKESVARFVEKLGLRAIILHEQPNAGRTIIEKFEAHATVSFAIVLLTPDDVAMTKVGGRRKQSKPRARQNVILELGYFMGKLGRGRVCALYKKEVEIPSDYQGILYIPMDSAGAWRMALAKEIKNAGIDVDLNKL